MKAIDFILHFIFGCSLFWKHPEVQNAEPNPFSRYCPVCGHYQITVNDNGDPGELGKRNCLIYGIRGDGDRWVTTVKKWEK